MTTKRWAIAIPLAVLLLGAPVRGATIRDDAGMFSASVVEQARLRLDRLERSTSIPVVIETIGHLPGLAKGASAAERREAINQVARRRDSEIRDEGIYLLISRDEHLISQPMIRKRLEGIVPESRRDAIREAFIGDFRKGDFDGGLKRGVEAIESTLEGHRAGNARAGVRAGVPAPAGAGAPHRAQRGGGSGLFSTFLLIGLGILGVLLVLRVLGGLFGRSSGAGYPGQMGPMGGPRPGMGPGGYYGGGPGYGGRGGGFFSGLLGGLGGAMAGNWLYDQMSGRHGGMTSADAGYPADPSTGAIPDQGDDAIVGADDHGGQGGDWGGGTDTGGGDWGGGDAGGDWGGGGGDWGGGGGDWGGGGGGGGDW